ncbi:MAG: VanW family protein [Patescibacteria group bacterium]|jgi:vancomycin resistance protein YoaR
MPEKTAQKPGRAGSGSAGKTTQGKQGRFSKNEPRPEAGRFLQLAVSGYAKVLGLGVLLLIAGVLAGIATLTHVYAQRVYPGVVLGAMDTAGKTADELHTELTKYSDALATRGVTFMYGDNTVALSPVVLPEGGTDFAYEMFGIDVDASVAEALAVGRTGSVLGQRIALADAVLTKEELPLHYSFDRESLMNILRQEFSDVLVPAQDAEFRLDDEGTLFVLPNVDGITLSFDTALATLEAALADGRVPEPFILTQEIARATAKEQDLLGAVAAVQEVLDQGTIVLTGPDEKRWEYAPAQYAPFMSVGTQGELILNRRTAKTALDVIGNEVVIEPKNGKFERQGDKVIEFQVADNGRKLNMDATQDVLATLLLTKQKEGAIVLETLEPEVTSEEITTLGLADLIGVGHSNFAGSPTNRRHNIAVGAAAVHGSLIAPGEEFSLVKTLGRIDGTTGYRQELVIKGNKTIPEYGGGLCQIGTTTFRGALASGLPITARTNHSYAVSYYNDENGLPGTDATIYDPAPDFRFMNDTGHYVLIQTRIDGNNLYFEYWGTDDGRVVQQTKPVVFGRVAPPPTKYIETTDLAPGQEKCTESAHAGINAQFTYTVTYPDGEVKEEVFTSHYRPWQAVCLRGVAPEDKIETPEESTP